MLIDHPSAMKESDQHQFAATFADEPFSSWIHQYGATPLTHILF